MAERFAHIRNDMSGYAFWTNYIDWREPTEDDDPEDYGELYVLASDYAELESRLAEVRMNTGCARGQHTTQFCAEVVARDKIITELLEMLRPSLELVNNAQVDIGADWELTLVGSLYARACKIAGREE